MYDIISTCAHFKAKNENHPTSSDDLNQFQVSNLKFNHENIFFNFENDRFRKDRH